MIKVILHTIINFTRKIRDDNVAAFSAQAAFFIMISIFPFLMFLLTLIQYLPVNESTVLIIINDFFPSTLSPLLISFVTEVYDKGSTAIISITVLSALWSASRGFLALVRGLNSVYEIKETRNYFKLRFASTLYTFVFALVLIISLLILVFGNRLFMWIESLFPVLSDFALFIISLRTFIALAILILFFLMLFVVIPNRKSKFMNELPGAIIAATGWMIFSYLYSYYIDNMSNFSNMYGSLTAIVLLMLWLYFCMYILFIGGEINDVLASKNLRDALKNPEKYGENITDELFHQSNVDEIINKLPKQLKDIYDRKTNDDDTDKPNKV
jgi:membrane protein